ncbi:aromatic motif membrane protein [Metamycoplasma canadense]|uniref:Lipoprotein n=1 Tax=Metamycoplasma canadense TaxID=29554 RepID=A0A077L5T7_9BACT|nr:aromatic motif membrane protein [Metamycoplasma canadense]BAP39367.1 lipoprotein [Metamycoplasma canadense]
MKKINKFILLSSPIITPLLTISLVSCIESNQNVLEAEIPGGFKFIPSTYDPKETKTANYIEFLLKKQFRNNEVEKAKFLKNQQDEKKLFEEIKKISEDYKNNKLDFELSKKFINDIKNFYSKNWLFMLKNIEKFNWQHLEWWKFEPTENAKHSDEFLNKLSELSNADDYFFYTNYWDELKEGDESAESPNDVFYLKKDKMIIRILISKNKEGNKSLFFDKIILFPKARNNKIVIKLISDTVHNAIIHGFQAGYNTFEKDIFKNFGHPALGLLLVKEIEGENNENK